MSAPGEPAEPDVDDREERLRRAEAGNRGVLAGVLGLEALSVLLLPVALRATHSLGLTRTLILFAFAFVLVAAAGAVRRPQGIAIGGVMQLLFMLTGFFSYAMFVLGAAFWAVWWRGLVFRRDVLGKPGGLRMLVS